MTLCYIYAVYVERCVIRKVTSVATPTPRGLIHAHAGMIYAQRKIVLDTVNYYEATHRNVRSFETAILNWLEEN